MDSAFLKKRFVIVVGKGGVGKSTLCAALGLLASQAGRRTIIAELTARETLPSLFGKGPSGYEPHALAEGLYSMNIHPEPALHEYALRKVKFERLYRAVFENDAVKRLLRMIPGMRELLLLGKAFDLERQRRKDGEPMWDMVIVDAPATGHGISLLRLPQVILDVVDSGPLAEEARAMRDLLGDGERTMLNLVTLAEEMPVQETMELYDIVQTTLQIPMGMLFINGVWPDVTPAVRGAMDRVSRQASARGEELDGALVPLEVQMQRRRFQDEHLHTLAAKVDLPQITIPYLFVESFDRAAIDTISRHLAQGMAQGSPP